MHEIAITGIGLVTPLGAGRERTWQALINSASAVQHNPAHPDILTATIDNFPFPPELRLLSMSFLAAAEAVDDARLDLREIDPARIGCTISASKPNLAGSIPDSITVNELYYPSTIGEQIYRIMKLRGPLRTVSAACATGTHAIMLGAQWIRDGLCDVVVAGAAESSLHQLYTSGFAQMNVLAKNRVCPFDLHREGFAIGEGAGVVILENKQHALMRGARIWALLSGWAMTNDTHATTSFCPDGSSIAAAMRTALAAANFPAIDYINAHGTGTAINDRIESCAINQVFGAAANNISVSSTKAATGHLLGASGAVEFGITLLALRDKLVPPTLNLSVPDPACNLDYTPHMSRRRALATAMSLSFGFGGQIGVLIAHTL